VIDPEAGSVVDPSLVVVDDEHLTLDIVGLIMRGSGVSYVLFSDPAKAMFRFCVQLPGMLIVDYYMSVINGLRLLACLDESYEEEHECRMHLCSTGRIGQTQKNVLDMLDVRIIDKAQLCFRSHLTQI